MRAGQPIDGARWRFELTRHGQVTVHDHEHREHAIVELEHAAARGRDIRGGHLGYEGCRVIDKVTGETIARHTYGVPGSVRRMALKGTREAKRRLTEPGLWDERQAGLF